MVVTTSDLLDCSVFRLNSLYAPEYTSGSSTSYIGFAEYMSIYKFCEVLSIKVEIEYVVASSSNILCHTSIYCDTNPDIPTSVALAVRGGWHNETRCNNTYAPSYKYTKYLNIAKELT